MRNDVQVTPWVKVFSGLRRLQVCWWEIYPFVPGLNCPNGEASIQPGEFPMISNGQSRFCFSHGTNLIHQLIAHHPMPKQGLINHSTVSQFKVNPVSHPPLYLPRPPLFFTPQLHPSSPTQTQPRHHNPSHLLSTPQSLTQYIPSTHSTGHANDSVFFDPRYHHTLYIFLNTLPTLYS